MAEVLNAIGAREKVHGEEIVLQVCTCPLFKNRELNLYVSRNHLVSPYQNDHIWVTIWNKNAVS